MPKNNETLPYSFDLLYDIKTTQQLVNELAQLSDRLDTLVKMVKHHGVSLESMKPSTDMFNYEMDTETYARLMTAFEKVLSVCVADGEGTIS